MIEQDTVRLLRECDAGIKMGTGSISDVVDHVKSAEMRRELTACREGHEALGRRVESMLAQYHDEGKNPNPVAKGMSWMKTNMMLAAGGDDKTIADLMTDGCNMGVKSLSRYLNQYQAADERSKKVARELIDLEHQLTVDLREYL